MKIHTITCTTAAAGMLLTLPSAFAEVAVPHTFVAGEEAVASEVNENFSVLADEINSLGEVTVGTSFGDYFISPSSNGNLGNRNVVAWEENHRDCYVGRGFFENTESIAVGSFTDPVTIFVWQQLCTDGDPANVIYEREYVYGYPADGSGADGSVIVISEDGTSPADADADGILEIVAEVDFRAIRRGNSLPSVEVRNITHLHMDGDEILFANNWGTTMSHIDQTITVNGLTFDDVVVSSFDNIDRIRFHTRDIGPILEVNACMNCDPAFPGNQRQRGVVFYRTEAAGQAGSLNDTPFPHATNVWFAE